MKIYLVLILTMCQIQRFYKLLGRGLLQLGTGTGLLGELLISSLSAQINKRKVYKHG